MKRIIFSFVWIVLLLSAFAVPAKAVPIVSNIEPTSISDNSFVVTWSTTNEISTTEVVFGIGGLTNITTVAGTTKYHYAELTGLYPNTTYQYRVKSGSTYFPPTQLSPLTFTTLAKPSGQLLFSFAVLNDLRYAPTKANTTSARGIPYKLADGIISSEVADIKAKSVNFTVINGNIADSSATYTTQISTTLKNILEGLTGASDLSSPAYKYLPTTGYHDRKATYTTAADDWLTDNMLPLTTSLSTTESRITSLYGVANTSKDVDSVFNYQFKYLKYNFIFLDSVKDNGAGSANLDFLNGRLSAESNSKTFIFMSFPAYNPFASPYKDYPVDIPTTEVGGATNIANDTAFRATLEAYKDSAGNPIVAAVISAHLGDNYLRDINSVSYVRQGPALQFPTGYSLYKVYTNGYTKTFYKTTGGSPEGSDTKPYYEYARDLISAEGGIPSSIITQFWLGSDSQRNFTYSYPFIPGLSPSILSTSPASNETKVTLNKPILITFNKRMLAATNLTSWVTIKDSDNNSISISSASFVDANRTILKITHSDLSLEKTYTVTVSGTNALDEGSTAMGSNYVFSFDTKGFSSGEVSKDSTVPTASISALPNNSTTNPFPSFSGIATDESGVANVEYKIDSGSFVSAEAMNGFFGLTSEAFRFTAGTALSAGSHRIYLRTTDLAGNTSAEGFSAYSFTVTSGKPTISVKINGQKLFPGDSISATPKFEITVTSANGLASGKFTLDTSTSALTSSSFANVDTNYYATKEVTTALSGGLHGITIEAFDSVGGGATYEVIPLYVQAVAAAASLQGASLSYPNPFDPGTTAASIGYTMTKSANIALTIHDLTGTVVAKKSYLSSATGGSAGYNEVSWDGKDDNGNYVGNGIYLYLLTSDGNIISRGKLTVIKK